MSQYGFGDDISDAMTRGAAARAGTEAAQATASARHLEARLERLSLVCMAMWSLLQDKLGVTEEELIQRVKLLDTIDGVEDGKATRTVGRCANCHRPMNARHQKCLYCGAQKIVQSAFDTI